ncbi:hypothetical protein M8J77_025970 [Diaphorina citri]|nr:hypothetical protein M8J77_025970 [Diaphorina citri]
MSVQSGVPILAAGQRDPAALPSCAAAAYCFLCILMQYFPNQAAGSRCPAARCWAALPSRSESSVVALPVRRRKKEEEKKKRKKKKKKKENDKKKEEEEKKKKKEEEEEKKEKKKKKTEEDLEKEEE